MYASELFSLNFCFYFFALQKYYCSRKAINFRTSRVRKKWIFVRKPKLYEIYSKKYFKKSDTQSNIKAQWQEYPVTFFYKH